MKTLVLGGSRGLGLALAKAELNNNHTVTIVSRTAPPLECEHLAVDLSKTEQLAKIQLEPYDKVIYCAGGGPYGNFSELKWQSHQWALQVSFLSAAEIAHRTLQNPSTQFLAIGSDIVESAPDPKASSYAAAKLALKGLMQNLAVEGYENRIGLASPGYIDTSLLPPKSWPREQGLKLWDANELALEILRWFSDRSHWHQSFPTPS